MKLFTQQADCITNLRWALDWLISLTMLMCRAMDEYEGGGVSGTLSSSDANPSLMFVSRLRRRISTSSSFITRQ